MTNDSSTLPRRGYNSDSHYTSDYSSRQEIRDRRADEVNSRKFKSSILWTIVGTVIPGAGLLKTKARNLGIVIMGIAIAVLVFLAFMIKTRPARLISFFVRPSVLTMGAIGAVMLGLCLVALIVASNLLNRPSPTTTKQRGISGVIVALMCFLVTIPTFVAASYFISSSSLINNVFRSQDSTRSETRPDLNPNQDQDSFWDSKPRLNLLLLGGDSAEDRADSLGIRTDTIILASIDTKTGDTVFVQLPRNMAGARFSDSTELGKKLVKYYPKGFTNGDSQDWRSMINSIWNEVPGDHPELFANTDYPGADALKIAVAGSIGIMPDYFMLIDIDGIQALIDAMGGVKINVNQKLPIGGGDGRRPVGYLYPGPEQLLSGYKAMWYARSRQSTNDYDRMGRQTCLMKAIIDQANPSTMLTKYEAIAAAGQKMIKTDIPSEMLPHLVNLSWKVKDGSISRVLFVHLENGFNTNHPDFDMMTERVRIAIEGTKTGGEFGTAPSSPNGQGSGQTQAPQNPSGTTSPSQGSSSSSSSSSESKEGKPIEQVDDVCAYHPRS